MPEYWSYAAKQRQVLKEEVQLEDHVEEFMENLSRVDERLRLYGVGALALEKDNAKLAARYILQVKRQFGIDLRVVASADDDALPQINSTELHEISRITPAVVIRLANQKVTARLKEEMDQRVHASAAAKADLLRAPKEGVPNPKFDGQSTD